MGIIGDPEKKQVDWGISGQNGIGSKTAKSVVLVSEGDREALRKTCEIEVPKKRGKKGVKSTKIVQKAFPSLPQTRPKRLQNDTLSCNPRKSKIMQPSHVFAHF